MDLRTGLLDEQVLEVKASGALDEEGCRELRVQLLDSSHGDRAAVLLDLCNLERIDPAGMALLMLARVELEGRGSAFVVVTLETAVGGTLRRAGLGRFVRIANSRADALRMLGRRDLPRRRLSEALP